MEFSNAFKDFVGLYGSEFRALNGGVIDILSGSAPASVEDAETGSLLLRLTDSGSAFTAGVLSSGTVTMGGSNGSLTALTVNGVSIIESPIAFTSETNDAKALAVADAINNYLPFPVRYKASANGAVVTLTAPPGSGTTPNGYVVASTVSGSLTAGTANMAGGSAASGGLKLAKSSTSGKIEKSGVWSGTILVTDTPSYFRYKDLTGAVMAQGSCGLYDTDIILSSMDFRVGVPYIHSTFSLTIKSITV